MRIVEIRLSSDLGKFKPRIPSAILWPPVTPPLPQFPNKTRVHNTITFDDTDLAVFVKRYVNPGIFAPVPRVLGAASLLGQGILTANGLLYNFAACLIDSLVTAYNMPHLKTPKVLMPIAYVTKVNMPGDTVGCTGTTTTVPATGALQTLVEGNSVPSVNQ